MNFNAQKALTAYTISFKQKQCHAYQQALKQSVK